MKTSEQIRLKTPLFRNLKWTTETIDKEIKSIQSDALASQSTELTSLKNQILTGVEERERLGRERDEAMAKATELKSALESALFCIKNQQTGITRDAVIDVCEVALLNHNQSEAPAAPESTTQPTSPHGSASA